MPGKVTITITDGPRKDNRWAFDEHDTFLVGRSKDCHLRLPDKDRTVSRRHCIIEINPPIVRVRDLTSFNGTMVNGKRYGGRTGNPEGEPGPNEPVDLQDGDIVKTGKTTVRIGVMLADVKHPTRCSKCRQKATEQPGIPDGADYLCAECLPGVESDPVQVLIEAAAPAPIEESRIRKRRDKERETVKKPKALPREIPGYDIVQLIGRGKTGAAYLARRQEDSEVVAFKVLISRVPVSEDARKRLLAELEPLKGLRHENIVSLHDFGAGGSAFYSIGEYCPAGSAAALMNQTGAPLPIKVAGPLMLQALDGLAFAHEKGIVHRALSPDNILLVNSPDGPAKICDFGLAGSFEKAGLSGLTAMGKAYGKAHPFTPREQLTNYRDVKPVSDVWAIAASFYTLLTGQHAREASEGQEPVEIILNQAVVPIRKRNPDVPDRIAQVIEHALADNPERRYPTAGAFRKDMTVALG